MTNDTLTPSEPPRRFHLGWVLPTFFKPGPAMARVTAYEYGAWLTPLLLLTVLALARVVVAGPLQAAASQAVVAAPPQGFDSMSPDQQQQVMQAQSQAQSLSAGPLFVYGFPAFLGLAAIWGGWPITFGLLHLVLTLLGGRGSTRGAMNVVAWAALPFGLRDLVRIGYMLVVQKVIAAPGLSGFAPSGGLGPFWTALLGQIDLYFLWYIVLIVVGVMALERLARVKAAAGALVTLALLSLFQALPGLAAALLFGAASSSTTRPF